jgi:hypothetical protein
MYNMEVRLDLLVAEHRLRQYRYVLTADCAELYSTDSPLLWVGQDFIFLPLVLITGFDVGEIPSVPYNLSDLTFEWLALRSAARPV